MLLLLLLATELLPRREEMITNVHYRTQESSSSGIEIPLVLLLSGPTEATINTKGDAIFRTKTTKQNLR